PVDDRVGQVTDTVLERAWLYPDPGSFREGVLAAAAAFRSIDEPEIGWSFDRADPSSCPECRIPFDDDAESADDPLCPWCGARRPDQLQELVWAEMRTMEVAWPEAIGT